MGFNSGFKGLIFKKRFYHTGMTNLLKVNNKCLKIPPSTSVHSATRVRRSRVARLRLNFKIFVRTAATKMQASELFVSCILLSYVNFTLHPTPQTKI